MAKLTMPLQVLITTDTSQIIINKKAVSRGKEIHKSYEVEVEQYMIINECYKKTKSKLPYYVLLIVLLIFALLGAMFFN